MWFKKKSVLQAENHYDTEKSADGSTDLRTTYIRYSNTNSSINNSGVPSPADLNNYFYLPALGYYNSGQLNYVGEYGVYWSSSANSLNGDTGYNLGIGSGWVTADLSSRYFGFRAEAFQ